MSAPKHTPGEWRYKIAPGEIHKHAVFGPEHPVDGGDYAPLARFAKAEDARLCAAAPELLAALQVFKGLVEDDIICAKQSHHKLLVAALTNANVIIDKATEAT